jgi:competence protein ComGC
VKALQMLVLVLLVVAVLFVWVFPALAPHLPFEDVTIETGATS